MQMIVALGGSFGAMRVLLKIVAALPANFPGTLLIVTHIGQRSSFLAEILQKASQLPVRDAVDGEPVVPGIVLVAPSDRHMQVSDDGATIHLHHGPRENHTRPAIDPLFRSVAQAYGERAIGVLLTGYLDDGVAGLQAIKSCGGRVIVQDPADAAASSMPLLALESVAADLCLPSSEIGASLVKLISTFPGRAAAGVDAERSNLKLENLMSAGEAGMAELARLASPSTYTCPECSGTLWQLHGDGNGDRAKRFRCHTGHAFTARILQQLQNTAVEDALWAALRALQERERMLRDLHASGATRDRDQLSYAEDAAALARQAALLRQMLTAPPAPSLPLQEAGEETDE